MPWLRAGAISRQRGRLDHQGLPPQKRGALERSARHNRQSFRPRVRRCQAVSHRGVHCRRQLGPCVLPCRENYGRQVAPQSHRTDCRRCRNTHRLRTVQRSHLFLERHSRRASRKTTRAGTYGRVPFPKPRLRQSSRGVQQTH